MTRKGVGAGRSSKAGKSCGKETPTRTRERPWDLWSSPEHPQGEQVTNVAFSASQTVCKVFLRPHKFICCSYTVKELQVVARNLGPSVSLGRTDKQEERKSPLCGFSGTTSAAAGLGPYPTTLSWLDSLLLTPLFPAPPLHIILSSQFFYIHEVRGAVTWPRTDLVRLKEFNCISEPEKRASIIQTLVGSPPPSLFLLLMLPTDLRESVTSPYSSSLVCYITMATTTVLLTQPMTFSQFSYYLWPTSVHSKFQCLSHTVSLACSSDSEFPPVKENQLGMVNNFCTVS